MNQNNDRLDKKRVEDILSQIKGLHKMVIDEEYGKLNLIDYACQEKYIRICNDKFRAVSLKDGSPLCGFANTGAKKINTIAKHFEEANHLESLKPEVWVEKEERRVQAWLIKQALINNRDLLKPLGMINTDFKELLFALDEIPLGSDNNIRIDKENRPIKFVRCDILAIGSIDGCYFPVQIELKYDRARKRLIEQFDNFEYEVNQNEDIQNIFNKLLKASVRRKNIKLQKKIRKIIVWPAAASEKTISELHEKEICVIEYKCSDKNKKHEKHENCSNYKNIEKWIFSIRKPSA